VLVLQPIGWIVLNGWRDDLTGAWSAMNYVRIFTTPHLIEPMVNSLILAASTAAIATALGVPMAWLVARTDMPGRDWIRVLVLLPLSRPLSLARWGGFCWPRPIRAG